MGDTRVVLHQSEIDGLSADPEIREMLHAAAEQMVVPLAQANAPKRTGAGAASIRSESVLDGPVWVEHISWDQDHFYMYFQDRGTRVLPARTFLEDSLEGLSR